MKNEKGFTLIEMLIAMLISTVLLASTVYVYTKQDNLLRDENSNVQLRDFARLAIDTLVPDIRLAGYGFPPGDSAAGRPAQAITVADVTTLTYMANTDDVATNVNVDSTATTNNWVSVPDTTGFAANDNVVFFDAGDPTQWNFYPVAGVNPNIALVWTAGNQNGFDVVSQAPVIVSKYHTITYNYNSGTQIITVTDDNGTDDGGGDDTTITVANNVLNLTFSYFDANGNALATPLSAADRGDVRLVQVSITVVDAIETAMTATLSTNVHMRNMGP